MIIKHLSYRVEFQGRGAAHIHGVIWLNIKEMEQSEMFKDEGLSNGILSEAFKKLRDDVKLTEDEKEAIVKLTDMFVSCSLNPETAHKDKELAKKLVDIIKSTVITAPDHVKNMGINANMGIQNFHSRKHCSLTSMNFHLM